MTEVRVIREQPVPFSHKHHVSGLGIDCRYCHTSVETSSFAGIPPTATCMTCHSEIWTGSPMLEPVRASLRTNEPLRWTRVHDLPDFVYFDHSIHLAKGIGCSTCHGRVDQMPITWRENSLLMEWCLNCHRQPEQYVRPRSAVFQMDWVAPPNQLEAGRELVQTYHIRKLTDCYICHR
jgi:ferredoxin